MHACHLLPAESQEPEQEEETPSSPLCPFHGALRRRISPVNPLPRRVDVRSCHLVHGASFRTRGAAGDPTDNRFSGRRDLGASTSRGSRPDRLLLTCICSIKDGGGWQLPGGPGRTRLCELRGRKRQVPRERATTFCRIEQGDKRAPRRH